MPSLNEMKEKRTRLIAEAQQIVLAETVTTEARAKFDAMIADVEVMEADIDRIEKIEALNAETRTTVRPPRPVPGASLDTNEKAPEVRAFENYIRYGKDGMSQEDRSVLRERRDITTGPTSGGYLIPQVFNPTLIDAQKLIGNTVSIVGKKVTNNNGAPIKGIALQRYWKLAYHSYRRNDCCDRAGPHL
jgi:HK97 family phage major capsid protein